MSGSGGGSGAAPIEELIDLPLMTDPAWLATLDVLIKALWPAISRTRTCTCLDDLPRGESQP